MQLHPFATRFTTALVTASLLAATPLPARAQEQPAAPLPQPLAATLDQPETATPDPPTRVGRLARTRGTVSIHPAGAEAWDRAQANWPLTTGNSIWTEPDSRAEMELAGGVIQLEGGSEFDIDRLDNSSLGATLRQGEIRLRLPNLAPGQSLRVQTPRGLVTIAAPGRYEIAAGDTGHPTRVTVHQGAAELGDSLQLGARQTALVSGDDPFTTATGPAGPDRFQSIAPPRAPVRMAGPRAAAPAVVEQMPGGPDLAAYGAWEPTPEYGAVWYPPVAAGWAPYRTGHWAFVAPWGWTWIDDAPWGFAPFHYGRWLQYGGRWGWTPGGYDRGYAQPIFGQPGYIEPVYAPALVTFFGVGLAVGAVIGGGFYADNLYRGNIGWCPLGPREVYRPWYRASPAYVRNVNVTNVTNITTINNTNVTSIQNFRNSAAATQIPAAAMVASQPVQLAARPVAVAQLAAARPIIGQQPIAPTAATAGMPAGVAPRPGPGTGPATGANAGGTIAAGAIAAGAVGAAAVAATRPRAPGPPIRPAAQPPVAAAGQPSQGISPQGGTPPRVASQAAFPQAGSSQNPIRPPLAVAPTRPGGAAPSATTIATPAARPPTGLPPALPPPGPQRPAGVAIPGLPAAGAVPTAVAPAVPSAPSAAGVSPGGSAARSGLPSIPRPTTANALTPPLPSVPAVAAPRLAPAAPPPTRMPPGQQPNAAAPAQVPIVRSPAMPVAPPPVRAAPPAGVNAAPAAPAYRAPPQPAFRAPSPQPAFSAPPPQPVFRAPPPQPVFRAPPPQPVFRAPPPVQAPPPQPAFRPPPPPQARPAPPPQPSHARPNGQDRLP